VIASTLVASAAAGCSGSGDPVVSEPVCYTGSAGALGLTEKVDVTLRDFNAGTGHIDVSGGGIEGFTCSNHAMSKAGQAITSDLSDCVPSAIVVSSIKYCSDSDTVAVTVKVKALPIPIKATLNKVDCGSTQESAMDIMWNSWSSEHSQNGAGDRKAFEANVRQIIETNREADGFLLGVNKFAGMTPEEFSQLNGYKQPKSREAPTLGLHKYSGAPLPESVDWSEQGAVTPVKDQGQCGGCWAFSTTGALEGRAQLAKGNLVSLSEQQFIDCDTKSNGGCQGGFMDDAFKYAEGADICTEDSYPYTGVDGSCHATGCTVALAQGEVTGYIDVEANEDALAEAVSQGPVSVAVDATKNFQLYSGGVMSFRCNGRLDHAILVVGYGVDNGKKYWKVKNSWGTSWGEQGFLRMQKGKGAKGECGILTGPPSYPVIDSAVTV